MAAPSPTLAAVITAANTAVAGASGVTTALAYDPAHENEAELCRANQDSSTFALSLAVTSAQSLGSVEGPGTQEFYSLYEVRTRYYALKVNDADQDADHLAVAENIRTALEGASSVFAINGQRQVVTPETVEIARKGWEDIPDLNGNPYRVWTADLVYRVEARRFA